MPPTTPLRAVGFSAVSSGPQRDGISLELQVERYREACAINGWRLVAELAVPGHSRGEPDLFKLFEDYEKANVYAYHQLRDMWYSKSFDVLVAYSMDRLGRSGTIIHWVIESTIRNGGQLYLTDDGGLITQANARYKALFGTAAATIPMDGFKDKTKKAKSDMVKQGLPTGSKMVISHKVVRDEDGNATGIVVNEAMRPFFAHAAQLLLDRVAWTRLGTELYRRYGYVTRKGKPYSTGSLYDTIMNPRVWGNNAEGWTHSATNASTGRWIFDDDETAPDGVKIYYGAIPAMYTGETADALKAEIRRRMLMRGKARPASAYRFSRLCVCGECGGFMRVVASRGVRHGLKCDTAARSTFLLVGTCSQNTLTQGRIIQEFVSVYIARLLSGRPPEEERINRYEEEKARLETSLKQIDSQIDRLMDEQSRAEGNNFVQSKYRARIATMASEMETLQAECDDLERRHKQQYRAASNQTQTLEQIRAATLENFWLLPDAEINQHLHRLFGDLRMVIKDHKIIALRLWKSAREY